MSFLVAEIWRGSIRRQTVRVFTDMSLAYQYYKRISLGRMMWEINLDVDEPMKPIHETTLKKIFEQQKYA